jgi:multisubunit Na+/H+ antiporter MnhF subunit
MSITIYNHGGGFSSIAVLIACFVVFKLIRVFTVPRWNGREFSQLLVVLFTTGISLYFWLTSYARPLRHPGFVWPSNFSFWGHYVNLVSWGFGTENRSLLLGWVCLIAVVAPLFFLPSRSNSINRIALWRSGALTLAILGMLMTISISRSLKGFGQAKSIRYMDFVMILMPLTASHWMLLFERKRLWGYGVVMMIWLFCLANFSNKWSGERSYKSWRATRISTWRCAEYYYYVNPKGYSPRIFFQPRASQLEMAKRLNLSFYKKMVKKHQPAA